MRKGKRILSGMMIILVLALGGGCVYFYPTWRASGILREKASVLRFSYEMRLGLDKCGLSEGQVRMFRILAELLGVEEEGMYSYRVEGSVWEDRAYALVYLWDASEPLAEFYISRDEIVLNEAMVYNTIRSRLVERYAILDRLIPEQEGSLYISLEQVEQMFGVELEEICGFVFPSIDTEFARYQYFLMLAAMSRERLEDGSRFAAEAARAKISLEVAGRGEASSVTMHLDVPDLAETVSELLPVLSRLEIRLPADRLRVLEDFSMTVAAGEAAEIVMPADYVDQDIVDLIAKIRMLAEKILNNRS